MVLINLGTLPPNSHQLEQILTIGFSNQNGILGLEWDKCYDIVILGI